MSEPTTTTTPDTTQTTPPETSSAPTGSVLTQSSGTVTETPPDWFTQLPEEIRSEGALKQFKDIGSLAKSYVHLNKKRNDALAVPGDDAKPEEIEQFYSKLGRPESPDKYDLKLPEGSMMKVEGIAPFKEIFHKAGLTPKQAQNILEAYDGQVKASLDMQKKANAEALSALQVEWGGEYNKRIAAAQAAVKEFGDDSLTAYLEESGLGNHPMVIRLMSKIGESLVEHQIVGQSSGAMGVSPSQIQAEIAKIEGNPILRQRNHPERDQLINRRNELYSALYPQEAGTA